MPKYCLTLPLANTSSLVLFLPTCSSRPFCHIIAEIFIYSVMPAAVINSIFPFVAKLTYTTKCYHSSTPGMICLLVLTSVCSILHVVPYFTGIMLFSTICPAACYQWHKTFLKMAIFLSTTSLALTLSTHERPTLSGTLFGLCRTMKQ